MLDTLVVAIAIVIMIFLLFPTELRRKLLGYVVAVDIMAHSYIITTYAAVGAVSGMTTAVIAGLCLSIVMRVFRRTDGYEMATINGESRITVIGAAILTQGAHWVRSFTKALFSGQPVDAPAPLNIVWEYRRDEPVSKLLRDSWQAITAVKW